MSKVRRKLEASAVRDQSSAHLIKYVNLYSKSLDQGNWSPNDALDSCRKADAQLLLRHFRCPLTDICSSAWHPSPLSSPSSQAFRPLLYFFSDTSILVFNQNMPQFLGRTYQFLGKTSLYVERVDKRKAKIAKILPKNPGLYSCLN